MPEKKSSRVNKLLNINSHLDDSILNNVVLTEKNRFAVKITPIKGINQRLVYGRNHFLLLLERSIKMGVPFTQLAEEDYNAYIK